MGIAPLGWASYSDVYATRRKVYLISISIYIFASIICAIVNDIWLLLIMRSIQACGGSSPHSIGAGTISDLFHSHERGFYYGIFYLGPLLGPLIGPVIGGYLTQYFGWRSIFLFLTLYGIFIFSFLYFALPETFRHPDTVLTVSLPKKSSFNPLSPLKLLCNSIVILITTYIGIIFAIIYVQWTSISRILPKQYNLSTSQTGLVFLVPGLGFMTGSVVGGKLSDYMLSRNSKNMNGVNVPEKRLDGALFGIITIPIWYVAYGWFVDKKVHIILTLLTMYFGAYSVLSAFNSTSTYLIDIFPGQSASIIAVNNFIRAIVGGVLTFAAVPLEDALGSVKLFTGLSILAIIGGTLLFWYKMLREKSSSNYK